MQRRKQTVDERPRGIAAAAVRSARMLAMVEFAVEMRRRRPVVDYAEIKSTLRAKFKCNADAAQTAIREADEELRQAFQRFCGSAPQIIFDGYLEIFDEAMRVHDLGNARGALDSVRDMFGMRGTINVRVTDDRLPTEVFAPVSDELLAQMAALDIPLDESTRMIDAASIEGAAAVVDALSGEGEE